MDKVKPVKPETRPEFEKKFAEIRKVTRNHTVETLTLFAGEYLQELESHLIKRNGIYEGKIIKTSL